MIKGSAGNDEHTSGFLAGTIIEMLELSSMLVLVSVIRGDESLRNLQVETPLRTITAIQNVTLVSMPDFLASLGVLSSLRADRTVTPTEARELTHKLRNIVSQLQS